MELQQQRGLERRGKLVHGQYPQRPRQRSRSRSSMMLTWKALVFLHPSGNGTPTAAGTGTPREIGPRAISPTPPATKPISFVDDADLEGAGIPPSVGQWNSNSSGDWNAEGNWSTGNIPNAPGNEADFFGAISLLQTVYTNAPITVGKLHFNNANEYVIAG